MSDARSKRSEPSFLSTLAVGEHMKIRGERECRACGHRWSYYETGSITCPDCGSIRSVGVDERTEHTDNPAELDLTVIAADVDRRPIRELAGEAAEEAADYVRTRGFIRGGELQPLDTRFVAAVELRHVGTHLARAVRVDDAEELYFLSQVRGAEAGERPPPAEVPESLAGSRGLAAAAIVGHYRRDLARYLDDHPDAEARRLLGRLLDHKKRVEAIDGDVPVEIAEALVQATVDLSHYAVYDDEVALASAHDQIDELV